MRKETKIQMTVAVIHCRRCRRKMSTAQGSIMGCDKEFQKLYDICKHCIRPEEMAEINKAMDAAIHKQKMAKKKGLRNGNVKGT